MVEIIPAKWTSDWVVPSTRSLMKQVGQAPVCLNKEIPGFVLNRIQYQILNECWRLIADGVVNVEDLDVVMSEGLGLRYAFIGELKSFFVHTRCYLKHTRQVSSMIHSARPTVSPVTNIVFAWNLFCFEKWGRTDDMWKNCGSASWINKKTVTCNVLNVNA